MPVQKLNRAIMYRAYPTPVYLKYTLSQRIPRRLSRKRL